jgi:hypothetical protein
VNAPAFLPATLSILMILVAAYALWRSCAAPTLALRTDIEIDVLLVCAAIAGAGLLSNWAHTLPRAAWTALFALGAVYFAVRTGFARADALVRGRSAAHALGCLVLLYMYAAGVAPSTLHGTTAGQYTMAGMPGMYVDTTVSYPALGLVCVVALVLYATASVARLGPLAQPAPSARMFAPRSVQACRALLALCLAYGILSKLV